MSVSDPGSPSPRNSLYSLASVGGVLLGAFLLAGASGHFAAVWPVLAGETNLSADQRFSLVLPGVVLLASGLIDIGLCRALWTGTSWALALALAVTVVAAIYFGYLLNRGVPDHPIGVFLALVSSYVLLLGAIRLGLTWPADVGGLDNRGS